MSLDLYSEEIDNRLASLRPATEPEPGMFDNFLVGSGKVAMQTFAKAGRAASMAVAPLAMALEKEPGSTEVQDRFFKAHDDIFGRAVDYWTPKPGEVGAAGQVVGQLLGTLPLVLANPSAAVATTQLATGEDLVRKGVDAGTAQAVGGVQAAGLGLGIWVPILGQTLAQRVLLGGAGFNVAQGLATRAASAELLEGTPGAEDFKALDPTALTLDVLLGAAFGGIAHINPRMRAEGDAWHAKLKEWGAKLKPSEVDALAALRQAQHLNADSLPGKPVDVEDVNAHVARMRQAIDDLANDRPVNVEDMPAGRFEPDAVRRAEAEKVVDGWIEEAGPLPEPAKVSPPDTAAYPDFDQFAQKYVESQPVDKFDYKRRLSDAENQADFLQWFYGSVVADAEGDPLIMYHGTAGEIEGGVFDRNKIGSATRGEKEGEGIGFSFTDSVDMAKAYANNAAYPNEGKVHEFYLSIKKPYDATAREIETIENAAEYQAMLEADGYDGIRVYHSSPKQHVEYVAFYPDQIRSAATNRSDDGAAPARAGTQEAGLDPLATSAARFAAEHPDLPIVVGKNADGSDITTTPRQWLEDADAAMRQAQDDARLFEIAAGCLLGGGR